MKKMKVRITLLEDMLGTAPNNKEIYSYYIASKAPDAKDITAEIESVGLEQYAEKQITVFHRNAENKPIIFDYLIKGFFKNACKAMRDSTGSLSKNLTAFKTKIDNGVFVNPRMIDINFEGDITICERPLRASTPQGDRVALSMSESIPAGATMDIEIVCLNDDYVKYVHEWLDYGKYNGLGQWHNSGKGRFSWEVLEADDGDTPDNGPTETEAATAGEIVVPATTKRRGRPKKTTETT